ncbi:gliding motility-associated C-terminal domain-containing protein [Prolixibacter denitrificans]|uniref:CHU domain-containing protein n=1 Tax=Prolixibacter denitrificans TaxID=1541063 RepID=A0A2P8CKZ8_9BACT|nr:gliding motility-associated C-terminal domain-containing protein [Prolixibacter denitrificans]PSK85655.1 CHU domain-containing protein [Prolixibacter denitrificans]GET20275.1 hypothetical protein JCM18694_05210 [Prolixibacter denitrificans]
MRSTFTIILLTICKLTNLFSATLFHENFENGQLDSWKTYQSWALDSQQVVDGNYSLRHFVFGRGGESYVSHPLEPVDLNAGNFSWEVTLSNGDWAPTDDEALGFWLCADTTELSVASGYVAGVNLLTRDNRLTLVRFQNGEPTEEILKTRMVWDEGKTVMLQITHSPQGVWYFSYRDKSRSSWSVEYEEAEETPSLIMQATGAYFRFSAAHSGQFWLDDIAIDLENTAPFVRNVTAVSPQEIKVQFSEKMMDEALSLQKYTLTSSQGTSMNISHVRSDRFYPASVFLEMEPPTDWELRLAINSISDEQGFALNDTTIVFPFALPAQLGDIVFTEVMADPSPSQGLPEAEFVELFNNNVFPLKIEGWELHIDNSEKELPSLIMVPQSYILLVGTGDSTLLSDYGMVYEIPGLSLRNSEFALSLVSNEGVSVDSMYYDNDFFEAEKQEGGWSLERIDPNRMCGPSGNWMASVALAGGTPGLVNSMQQANPDEIPPQVLGIRVESDRQLSVWFSESLSALPDISFSRKDYHTDSTTVSNRKTVEFFFPEGTFQEGNSYTLHLSAFTDECGNQTEGGDYDFTYRFLQPGELKLSEVLFNPFPDGVDFVELFNPGPDVVDLGGLFLATRNDSLALKQVSLISDVPRMLDAGEYAALSINTNKVKSQYFTECPDCFLEMNEFPSLPDDAGKVVLLNRRMEVLEEFSYDHAMHHPLVANESGVSLERRNFLREANEKGNWLSTAATAGFATPGYANSSMVEDESIAEWLKIEPKIFSPNDDGYNDQLIIHLSPGEPGWAANIRIFDTAGREIRRLSDNELLAAASELVWDGRKDNRQLAELGIYIIAIEAFNNSGQTRYFRKTCVLTDRIE